VRLQSAGQKAVEGLVVTGPARHQETLVVHPRQTVALACGGLGNAQILLQLSTTFGVPYRGVRRITVSEPGGSDRA
jgi:hypothetical protein